MKRKFLLYGGHQSYALVLSYPLLRILIVSYFSEERQNVGKIIYCWNLLWVFRHQKQILTPLQPFPIFSLNEIFNYYALF